MFVYQFMSEVVEIVAGKEEEEFDPHKNRLVAKPTTYSETMIHMLKGALGVGILTMPDAVRRLGLVHGSIGIIAIGLFTIYTLHILIRAQYTLCKMNRRGYMSYPKCMSRALKAGPMCLRRTAFCFYVAADATLVVGQLGLCTIYIVFVGVNLQQIALYHDVNFDLRTWMLFLLPAQILVNLIKDLKLLTLISTFSNFLLFIGLILVFYYLTEEDIHVDDEKFKLKGLSEIPIFVGMTLFAMESVGIILALEYNMENPAQFTGVCGVLTLGLLITITLFLVTGISGYLKYGENVEAAITLNLPQMEKKAQAARFTFAMAIYFSYPLQNFVAWRILWTRLRNNVKRECFKSCPRFWNYSLRVGLVIGPFLLAVLVPNLTGFIALFGSVCLSLIAYVFPGIMDACIWYPDKYGFCYYKLLRDIFVILFGLCLLISGAYTSVTIISHEYNVDSPCKYNVAYYTARPPAAPLMLVPVAPNSSGKPFSNCIAALSQFKQSASVVDSVLQDLITKLPVSPKLKRHRKRTGRAIRDPRFPKSVSPQSTRSPDFSRLSSVSSLNGDSILRCSVATQAQSAQSTRFVNSGVVTPASNCEWLGEVRELRDCHLRLVLRQLRHIAHLNHAVDRVMNPMFLCDGDVTITR